MSLNLIVAMTEERVIGMDNRMPWHLSEDLKRFKRLTMGYPIIMGRKTFESIGRVLPGRESVVVSRNPSYKADGVYIARDLEGAIRFAQRLGKGQVFIIGGAQIFREALPLCEKLFLTLIHRPYVGDTFFPEIDLERDYAIEAQSSGSQLEADGSQTRYSFLDAQRKAAL